MLPLEFGFLQIYQSDYPELQRLALFVLSHTLVDQLLSVLLTNDQLFDRAGTRSLPELRSIARTIRKRKFGPRLKSARALLSTPVYRATKDLNDARNSLLHAGKVPLYRGQKVTSLSGLRKCYGVTLAMMEAVVTVAARRQAAWRRTRRA